MTTGSLNFSYSEEETIASVAATVLQVAQITLKFGEVERAPYHPSELQHESDTTHTVMLTLLACGLADMLYPDRGMSRGLIAEFAAVHDLAEVYAGDVSTAVPLSLEDMRGKKNAELAGVLRLGREFGEMLPWLPRTLRAYEDQVLPEARFVRAVDKLLPKAVVLLERTMLSAREQGVTVDTLSGSGHMGPEGEQALQMREYAAEWPEILAVRNILVGWLANRFRVAMTGAVDVGV